MHAKLKNEVINHEKFKKAEQIISIHKAFLNVGYINYSIKNPLYSKTF